jgi:hypothetical protein
MCEWEEDEEYSMSMMESDGVMVSERTRLKSGGVIKILSPPPAPFPHTTAYH